MCDMMSPWTAVELMRQQTCVSCQCHPEGDVSNHGCLSFGLSPSSFFLTTHSLVPALCINRYASSTIPLCIISPFFSSAQPFLNISTCFLLSLLSVSLLSLLSLSPPPLPLSSLVVVSLRGAVLLLTVCYREQREGGRGNLWEMAGPCCRHKSWCTARYLNTVDISSFSVMSAFRRWKELPMGFFHACGWPLGYKSFPITALENNKSAS